MNKQIHQKITIVILFSILIFSCNLRDNSQEGQNKQKDIELSFILKEWANSFVNKVDKDYSAIINFTANDKNIAYQVIIQNKQYTLSEGINENANLTFKSTTEHYNKIYRGDISGFTSVGREKMSDSTPLDIVPHKPITDNPMNDGLFIIQRFFHTSPYDKIVLKKENSRIIHGGNAIPIFYKNTKEIGIRSAWYQIDKGQRINELGDTNPFPQCFIITKGQGYAKIGSDTIKIKGNESYYVAPGLDHVFWNESEEPIELIFLAWGKGA